MRMGRRVSGSEDGDLLLFPRYRCVSSSAMRSEEMRVVEIDGDDVAREVMVEGIFVDRARVRRPG